MNAPPRPDPIRIEAIRVQNYRALHDLEIRDIEPLTVLVGPNGSGKSTLVDVFAFLSECFDDGLSRAWERRGRNAALKTRGAEGPVRIELAYRERPQFPLITYRLEVDEREGRPIVVNEWLRWRRETHAQPLDFLSYAQGKGSLVSEELPDFTHPRAHIQLSSPDMLAVGAFGQLANNPRVVALRDFIRGWHLSSFSTAEARGQPEAGPQPRLSRTGHNLANVIQHLQEAEPERLRLLLSALRERVPRLESAQARRAAAGRLLLVLKDAPFSEPIMARFASDGTLKLLAYLILLRDPAPPPFIGMEEPENFLHPRLLQDLGEECREAARSTQVLATTHSPSFLNSLRPAEVQVLWRDDSGHSRCESLASDRRLLSLTDTGGLLGDLWMQGQFRVGEPTGGGGSNARLAMATRIAVEALRARYLAEIAPARRVAPRRGPRVR